MGIEDVTAEIHGFSDPGAPPTPCALGAEQVAACVLVFRVRPERGLGFRKGDQFSQTTWRNF